MLALFLSISAAIEAQQVDQTPSYWVVETNIRHPNFTIVRFYDVQDQLVHEVKIMGVYIDVRKPKQKRKLDQLLKTYHERIVASLAKSKLRREPVNSVAIALSCRDL